MSNNGFLNTDLTLFYRLGGTEENDVVDVRLIVGSESQIEYVYENDTFDFFTVDITTNTVTVTFLSDLDWSTSPFNGIQIADETDNLVSILGVDDQNEIPGIGVSFDANNLFINWQGLHFNAGDSITFTVDFGTPSPPVAFAGSESTDEETVLNGMLPEAEDDEPVHYVLDTSATYNELPAGILVFYDEDGNNFDGSYSYDPGGAFEWLGAGASAEVTFQYYAVDANGAQSAVKTITITVNGVNDAPVLSPDPVPMAAAVGSCGGVQVSSFLAGVNDIDAGALKGIAVNATAGNGTWEYSLDGEIWSALTASDGAALLLAWDTYVRFVTDPANVTTATLTYHAWDQTSGAAGDTADLTAPGATGGETAFSGGNATAAAAINGPNNPPTFGGVSIGEVTEDTGLVGDDLVTGGALDIEDIDPNESSFLPHAAIDGTYGTFSIDAAGNWTYRVDNDLAAVQALGVGATLEDSFNAFSADTSASQTVTVTIHGANDVPTIGGAFTGNVTEDLNAVGGNLNTDDTLTIADPDGGESNFEPQATVDGDNGLGVFTLDEFGHWTFTVDSTRAEVQALGVGDTLTDSFTAISSDGSASQLVTVTIHGANDVAAIDGVSTGDVTEDTAVDPGGYLTAAGILTVADPDTGQSTFIAQASVAGSSAYGTFTLDAAGNWTYAVDNTIAAIQALGAAGTLTDSFTAGSSDGSASMVVTVTIHGANDAATIGGIANGEVTEDGTLVTGGSLTVSDPDTDESTFTAQAAVTAAHGTFTLDAAGAWTYALDNTDAAVQALAAGAELTDSFTAASSDGSGTQLVTVTIYGTNDAATVGGAATADVTEDGDLVSGGLLTVSDPDTDESTFTAEASVIATYGTFTLNAAGGWTYSLDNEDAEVQALGVGAELTDSFTAESSDGSASVLVTVTIHGSNDAATIGGGAAGDVTEDGDLVTGGLLTVSDPDTDESTFAAQASVTATYGTFTLSAAGNWTYSLNTSHAAVQALAADGTLTDSFTAASGDGSGTQLVTVTIHGANDAATIGGNAAGDVTEDGDLVTGGLLTVSDPDTGQSTFTAQASVTATYGTFTLNAAGGWTYSLDNTHAAVQALAAGGTLADSFTAASSDGSDTQLVTVTIHGTNDAATISGVVTGEVTEDLNPVAGNLTTSGSLTVNDPDGGQSTFTAQGSAAGTYGTFTLNAAGAWTYSVGNGLAAVQALGAAGTLTDSFTAASGDGSGTQLVTVTIHGANDAPVAQADTGSAAWDETKSFDVVANDLDPDAADTRTVTAIGAISVSSLDSQIDGIDAGDAFSILGNAIVFNPGMLFSLLDHDLTATVEVAYTMKDSQNVTSSSTLTLTVSGVNHAPVITSNGGGATAAVSIAENQTAVLTVAATDSDLGDSLQFSFAGGADDAMFVIDTASGVLAFAAAPNFEVRADADHNNVYKVIVRASDGLLSVDQAIDVNVTNVVGVAINGTLKADVVNALRSVAGKPKPTGEEDYILGQKGNDTLSGLGGNDTINGGFGKNTLFGGAGQDFFVFSTKLGNGIKGTPVKAFSYDKIVDFSPIDDTIVLSKAIFKPLHAGQLAPAAFWKGAKAHDMNDRIIYKPANGALFFDMDGKGWHAPIQFATLPAHLALTNFDFLII